MTLAIAMDAGDEQARINEWRMRAAGFLRGGDRPRPMQQRDAGGIISDRQSRGRWSRGDGLEVRAPAMALLLAWIDAALSAGATDHGDGMALFETAWLRILYRAEGRVGLASSPVPVDVDVALRRVLLGEDVEDLILGYTERAGEWVPGYAGLTPVEAEAFRCSLEPRGEECHRPDREHRMGMRCLLEIRDRLDRRRGRRGMPLAIETVENRLSAARTKLKRWATEIRPQLAP